MRITNSMMVSSLMMNLEKNLARMSRKQDEMASGKSVIRASDNPIEASKILKYKTDISELDQFARNTNDALSWLEITESSISDTGTVLQRLRELSVQGANGTNTAEDTQKIAKEAENLRKQLISNGNFNFAGRYIFSGTQTDKPLFKDDGSFNINVTQVDIASPQKTLYQIGVGEDINVSTPGLDVYGYVPLNTVMTQTYPDGLTNASPATKATLSTGVELSTNFTTGTNDDATITVAVNGTSYILDSSIKLQPENISFLDLNGTTAPISVQKITALLSQAKDGGGNKLGDNADVYINGSGQLTIKSRSYGVAPTSEVAISFSADTGGGLTIADLQTAFGGLVSGTTVAGTNVTNATLQGSADLTSLDISTNITAIEGQTFTVSLNGVQKNIAIGTLTPPKGQAELVSAMNSSLDAAFGVGNVVASFTGAPPDRLTLTTANQPSDGSVPTLEMRVTKSTESSLIKDVDALIVALNTGNHAGVNTFLGLVDNHLNRVLAVRADIGARVNRMDLVNNRITDNNVSFTRMLSDSQDADMAEVIMNLKNAENVYKSALSVGARVIQPSLIDFIR